ncbi:hypothetical protein ACFX14_007759 [Malus domestica]
MLIWLVLETVTSYQLDLLQEREKKAKKKSSSATKPNSKEPIEPIAAVAEPGKCWVTTMFFEEGKMEPTEVEKGRELQFST